MYSTHSCNVILTQTSGGNAVIQVGVTHASRHIYIYTTWISGIHQHQRQTWLLWYIQHASLQTLNTNSNTNTNANTKHGGIHIYSMHPCKHWTPTPTPTPTASALSWWSYPPEVVHGGHTAERVLGVGERTVQEQFTHHLRVVVHGRVGHAESHCKVRKWNA